VIGSRAFEEVSNVICEKCQTVNNAECKFCGNCGNPLVRNDTETILEPKQETKKKMSKKTKIIIFLIIGFLAVFYFVYFAVPFIVNTPDSLTDKLVNTAWYSSPSSFVAVESGVPFDAAYSIEFFDDGTALKTTYACYGTQGHYHTVEVVEEKVISWSVDETSTLHLDNTEYSFKFLKDMESSGLWYFEDGNLIIGKTYYPEDEWGYAQQN